MAIMMKTLDHSGEEPVDWMEKRVAQSLADPEPNIPHAQVMADLQAVIDARREKHAGKTATS